MVDNTSRSWRCGIQLRMLKRVLRRWDYNIGKITFRSYAISGVEGGWNCKIRCAFGRCRKFYDNKLLHCILYITVTNLTARRNTCCVTSLVNMLLWCWQFGISLKHVDVHPIVSKLWTMIGARCAYDIFIVLRY
jgi:hypothetical protein